MEYSNRMNYPWYIVEWLKHDAYDYEPGTLSATSLIQPVRKTILERRHADELKCDVADCIPKRYGTALHDSMEAMDFGDDIKQEERFYTDLDFDGDTQRISGKFDILLREPNGERLVDLKSTSAWSYIFGSREEDHKLQMSILRYILTRNDKQILDVAHIVYIFTDWKRSDAARNQNYPAERIILKPLELIPMEGTELWIRERINSIHASMRIPDDSLPECEESQLWRRETKYAVMKEGRKSAVRVFEDFEEANTLLKTLDKKHRIDIRKGLVQRCGYCYAKPFCNQYVRMKEAGEVE